MGMKNRPDADTFGTGAVSQRVIEHTSCPVIGVRPRTPSPASAIPQIVCPVHLWETWRRGLDAAFALTRSFGAGSVVLNIASRAGKATTDAGASLDER